MASGRTNESNVVAGAVSGSCAVVFLCLFIVIGIPVFIASMVLFSIANGDYDDSRYHKYAMIG